MKRMGTFGLLWPALLLVVLLGACGSLERAGTGGGEYVEVTALVDSEAWKLIQREDGLFGSALPVEESSLLTVLFRTDQVWKAQEIKGRLLAMGAREVRLQRRFLYN